MGTLVTATSKADTKPNYTVETVAFGSVAVADGEFAVFVGADITSQTEASAGIQQCLQHMRDAHWLDPASLSVVQAIYDTAAGDMALALSETTVAIIQGAGFNHAGSSNSGQSHRLYEVALEDVLRAA